MKIELQIPPCSEQMPNMFKQMYLHKHKQIQMQSNTNRITNTTTIACGQMRRDKYQICLSKYIYTNTNKYKCNQIPI